MLRTKRTWTVPPETRKAIYDLLYLGVKHVDNAKYYGIKKCSFANVIHRILNKSKTIVKKREEKENCRNMACAYSNVTCYTDVLISCFLLFNN